MQFSVGFFPLINKNKNDTLILKNVKHIWKAGIRKLFFLSVVCESSNLRIFSNLSSLCALPEMSWHQVCILFSFYPIPERSFARGQKLRPGPISLLPIQPTPFKIKKKF